MTTASRPPATALLGARARASCSCYTTPRGTTKSALDLLLVAADRS